MIDERKRDKSPQGNYAAKRVTAPRTAMRPMLPLITEDPFGLGVAVLPLVGAVVGELVITGGGATGVVLIKSVSFHLTRGEPNFHSRAEVGQGAGASTSAIGGLDIKFVRLSIDGIWVHGGLDKVNPKVLAKGPTTTRRIASNGWLIGTILLSNEYLIHCQETAILMFSVSVNPVTYRKHGIQAYCVGENNGEISRVGVDASPSNTKKRY